MAKHEEYLRRNLVHCSSVGVRANLDAALARLTNVKKPPKWLVDILIRTRVRSDELPSELAKWRNTAPDSPR